MPELHTTNILLGVMAFASVLQILVLLGVGFWAFRLYRQTLQTVHDIEQRQIAPVAAELRTLLARFDAILDDVKELTARVTRRTERIDSAIDHTMDRVDHTAGRVRDSVGSSVHQLLELVHSMRAAAKGLFGSPRTDERPAA